MPMTQAMTLPDERDVAGAESSIIDMEGRDELLAPSGP